MNDDQAPRVALAPSHALFCPEKDMQVSRIPEYERGFRDGVRWAITLLHVEADAMNDETARRVLSAAAFSIGVALSQRENQEKASKAD